MGMERPNRSPQEKEIDTSEFTINPETGGLVSEGQEYANTPRMRDFIKRANAIRAKLSPPREQQVRLWRGNRINEIGENPSFTNSLEGIALPFLDMYGGKLSYVDVSEADLEKYVMNIGSAANSEFILPTELAKSATVIDEI